MREAALAYAEAGYPVLWVYGIRKDEETGEYVCTCPSPGTKNCNPGKHVPYKSDIEARLRDGRTTGGSTGHGAKDATTDPEVIETFPWDEDCNIAIAGRECFPIIDIDDPNIAGELLDPELCLRDTTNLASSGRGPHLYIQCAPSKNGILKLKTTGERIGEVRAAGLYAVAAPSLHYSGRRYQWLSPSIVTEPVAVQTDAWEYIQGILSSIGVEIKSKGESAIFAPRTEAIESVVTLPFTTDNATLLSMMMASYPTSDRSADLFRLGCELVREVKAQELDIDRHVLAGLVKHADMIRRHPKGPKYAFRENADDYYWELILSAEQSVTIAEKEEGTAEGASTEVEDGADHTYYYVENPPQFVDNRNPKRPKRISNFELKLVDRLRTWEDENSTKYIEQRVYRARQGLEEHEVTLGPKEYEDPRKWMQAIEGRMPLPPHFVVEDSVSDRSFKAATHHYTLLTSGVIQESDAYGFVGWLRNRDAFLLPGAPGLITADGFDESIRYALPPDEQPSFTQYGWNVVPKEDYPLSTTLRALYGLREPRIMVPLITQALAAPMQSVLKDESVTVLHLFAKTGSYKTTIARLVMSIYGKFWSLQHEIDEWKLTPATLEYRLHRARDLPILVDDFKLIGLTPSAFAERIRLIQNYGDRTAKGRMTREMRENKRFTPQALMISTGEDVWDGQESAAARTLVVDASLYGDEQALKRRISHLQQMAEDGLLGAIGYEWIRWLMEKGRVWVASEIDKRWRAKRVAAEVYKAHARVLSSAAMLLSVSSLVREFLQEKAPDFVAEYDELAKVGWKDTMNAAAARAATARLFSPYEQVAQAMREALTTKTAYLQPRTVDADGVGMQGMDTMGFIDQKYVWLNEGITLGWYRERLRRQGQDCHIGWSALRQEALNVPDATKKEEAVHVYGGPKLRMVGVPRAYFFEGEDPGAEDVSTHTTGATPANGD